MSDLPPTDPPVEPTSPVDPPDLISRDTPEPEPSRAALLASIQSEVRAARRHWRPVFDRMLDDQSFAMGVQWPGSSLWKVNDQYTCNVVLRHIQQLTAVLYAKNPTIAAKVRKRLLNTVWDGTFNALQSAMQALMTNPMDPNAQAILEDAQHVKQTEELLRRMGKTLEIVYNYNVEEQAYPFKQMMKHTVRRAIICGVGYVKLGFQRVTTRDPSGARAVSDDRERIDSTTRLVHDIADGEIAKGDAEMEEFRLASQALQAQPEIVVREGLVFDYPDSNMIIPDQNCRHLATFMGCRRVTEQFMLTIDQVQEIYGVDVSKGYTSYRSTGVQSTSESGAASDYSSDTDAGLTSYVEASLKGGDAVGSASDRGKTFACVWETYDRSTGLVYTTCDGYKDFLREPATPDVRLERFWPWFSYLLNETYHVSTPYPVSDVTLIRDMQLDINRSRQGLREHRHAARPKTLVSAGALDDEDKLKLRDHPANAVIELNGLAPGQKAQDLLFPWQGPGIDPNLYETKSAMDDILRVVGVQDANLGGVSGATATETSIAENSRVSSVDAAMDDMDTMLSQIARAGSQILLLNVSTEIAQEIAGPGAVWPQASALDVANELYLEVEAGSSGRPNQQREVQVMTQLAPILMQIPGINPEWLARQMLSRFDDRANLSDALAQNVPAIMAMNAAAGRATGAPPGANPAGAGGPEGGPQPSAQGPQGVDNMPRPPGQGGLGPRAPQPRPQGSPGPGPLTH